MAWSWASKVRHAALLLGGLLAAVPPVYASLTEAEQRARIALEVSDSEERLQNSGLLVNDPALNAYLQEITDRLFPDHKSELHVRAFLDSEFNAFTMPSGSIYFNTGALLRIRDEAELASVLGHEGTHYTADHAYRERVHNKHAATAALIGNLALPILSSVIGVSSMAGYSRDNEREADQGGFDRMSRCGYDPKAGSELFGLLDRELTVRAMTHGGYFWADHPAVKERITNLSVMATAHPAGTERNQDRYLAVTEHARLQALSTIHRRLDGKLLVFLLGDEKLVDSLPPRAHFYLAEGYRLRGSAGDGERALAEYASAINLAPEDPEAYQALGLRYMHDNKKSDALAMLRKYVELEHDPARSAYAQQYIQTLQGEAQ